MRLFIIRVLNTLIASLLLAPLAHAQAQADKWPADRPVRIIQAFSPGAATQVLAQDVGEVLAKAYGASYFVEAKPGAGGVIGTEYAAKAVPDGYTLLLGTAGSHAINPSIYTRLPYDPVKDFTPITLLADLPNVLLVPKNSPYNTLQELVAAAKANPGRMNFGSSGNGTSMHLAGEQFKAAAGVDITHVPFKESAQALTALMGGEIQLTFHQLSAVLQQVKAGQVKALAVTSKQRVPALSNVPTVAESGYPGFESITWFAMFGPARMPATVVDKINRAVTAALRGDLGKKIQDNGSTPRPSTPAELTAAIRKDSETWKKVVQSVGIKLD